MKYRVRIPKNLRRRFCRKCNSYFIFGKNARVRLKKKRVVVECLNCGFKRRYPYDRK
jgi:ribonuclease P protein subunit RPR2